MTNVSLKEIPKELYECVDRLVEFKPEFLNFKRIKDLEAIAVLERVTAPEDRVIVDNLKMLLGLETSQRVHFEPLKQDDTDILFGTSSLRFLCSNFGIYLKRIRKTCYGLFRKPKIAVMGYFGGTGVVLREWLSVSDFSDLGIITPMNKQEYFEGVHAEYVTSSVP